MKNFVCGVIGIGLWLSIHGNHPVFADSNEEKQMLIIFDEETSQQEIDKTVKSVDGDVIDAFEQVAAASIEIPEDSIDELQKSPSVKHVEEDILIHLSEQIEDWGIQATNIPSAWNSGFTGQGVKVAVIDSGIAPHSDLAVAGGVSTVGYTTSYNDDQGHGTHVAGIIGARNNNFGVKGAAYESELYAVKAFDQNGEAYLSDLIEGIDWSISNGMDIINLSSGTQIESAVLHSVIDRAYASGLLIVAAAGNDGAPDGLEDTVDFPARYSSVIGVGAVDSYFNRAPFSSTGPAVEVAAPGVRILSTYLGNQYAYMSGTSMAAPYVTGELVLLKQAYPRLTIEELRQVLIEHTRDLGSAGRDPFFGYGFIQASSFTEPTEFEEENPLTGINLSQSSLSGRPGDTLNVIASAVFKNGEVQNVTNEAAWSSANTAVATVQDGRVELKGYGSTIITVTYEDQSAVIIVNVPAPDPEPNPVVNLEVNQTILIGQPGEAINVTASATYKNGDRQNVTNEAAWSSANTAVAVVEDGRVEFTGYGSTTIIVTYEGQSTMIVVNSPEPLPESETGIHSFQDVSAFYAPAVEYLVRNQITQGLSRTEFGVQKDIIRADAAIWLAKELNLNTESAEESGFVDVPSRAAGAVNALKQAGIIGGKTATRFGASDPLTRGEVALILQRAFNLTGDGRSSSFTDVSSRYKEAVDALVANNITSGYTATQFGVARNITRGQLAVFLYRLSSK
ncbi:S8 family serine peptidase [Domibacillus sp. DTU_2020_1001157_1_SI_ALB_TIR_016]|uniref:S8 family peptidase n=1 Tax=Domibacillus sp. DTU_2020_1001157_1_SI_ALB_TIR_016 TaxID=3077789 RepID=UPI0028E9DC1E|nr:S8 family serine peptidase [Domibacillus sp. DTU_2020_1001157_1_SI_ALB_TIR_016]WNS79523.1 S8 family serine peptidase [Domibacillus sp. DTU_2020_1001157_1_SI_ALB_TIR_016]